MILISTIIWLSINYKIINGATPLTNCPVANQHFEKVLGIRPANDNHPLLLYKSNATIPGSLVAECQTRCQSNDQCRSFILNYTTSECYWYKNTIEGQQELNNVVDTNTAWFIKICLQSTEVCDKLWIFERIPGAILIGNDTKTLPNPTTRIDCQEYCLNETEFLCRSVKFKITNANYGPNAETKGVCVLSDADRHSLPNAYRVSTFDEEYFENQCANVSGTQNDFCAYEEYENATLAHNDDLVANKTKDECQILCDENETFNCRAFSLITMQTGGNICLLHSEDSKIYGPKLLRRNLQAVYYEKANCLNITVRCSETDMTVMYNPDVNFFGRLYMEGYSDQPECYASGQGKQKIVSLKLSLQTTQCGITKAVGINNRSLLSGAMILQYNSLIQTQSDRLIRVGCIFTNDSQIVIGTGVQVASSKNHGSAIYNSSTTQTAPGELGTTVQMRIIDFNSKLEVSNTEIGQELQLIIDVKPPNGPYDIWASHLIAMTERNDESIFLLDDRGCPTNLNVFPALTKVVTNTTRQLVANFQAFKFASSPVVRFSVLIQFCPQECPAINCGNNVESFGKRRRRAATVESLTRTEFEMPLEFIMIVRDPLYRSDSLVMNTDRDKRILVAGFDYTTNEVCLDYSLAIGLLVVWVIIQAVFVICCLVLVRKYRRYYKYGNSQQSMEELNKNFGIGFNNLENRRVRWADDN